MATFTCNQCGEIQAECACVNKKRFSQENKPKYTCVWQDSLGRKCGKEYFLHLPKPGVVPRGMPSSHPHEWNKFCKEHYDYESPNSELDDILDAHTAKLEEKYGKFDDHMGKDMALHCMNIMRDITKGKPKLQESVNRLSKRVAYV